MKPATPLPWLCDPTGDCGPDWIGVDGHFVFEGPVTLLQDARYTTHAANAYPKLVAELVALTTCHPERESALALLRELGEAG